MSATTTVSTTLDTHDPTGIKPTMTSTTTTSKALQRSQLPLLSPFSANASQKRTVTTEDCETTTATKTATTVTNKNKNKKKRPSQPKTEATPEKEGTSVVLSPKTATNAAATAATSQVGNKNTPSQPASSTPSSSKSNGRAKPDKTYIQLVEEAINNLKEYRTGSSLASIKKYIVTNYPQLYDVNQNNLFNSRIAMALKSGCQAKPVPRFQKIKVSYRIAPEHKNLVKNQKRQQERRKSMSAVAVAKAKSSKQQKPQQHHRRTDTLGTTMAGGTDEGADQVRAQLSEDEQRALEERRRKRDEAKRIKAAEEARLKQVMERIRRRKFPIEDTKLHAEDKLYHLKPPSNVTTRPYLPYFWCTTIPLDHPNRYSGKTNSSILNASKVDTLDHHDTRGIVPDLLHIYHFFMGDIHFCPTATTTMVPSTVHFKHLIYSVEMMLNGTMKRTKCVPPFLVHLFVTCLQILLTLPDTTATSDNENGDEVSKEEKQLRKDLKQYLYPALSASSWADITYLYMDAMQRFYTTDSSYNPNSIQPLLTDVNYLFGRTEQPSISILTSPPPKQKSSRAGHVDDDNDDDQNENQFPPQHVLPDGYVGYLGDERSSLHRAHAKLGRQDPWLLTAEEILALLRALTEDVLASHPTAANDIEQRDDQMIELLKNKRLADAKLRKMRLAYEGPKKPSKAKTESDTNKEDDDDHKNGTEKTDTEVTDNGKENGGTKAKPFVPTATKKQYEVALRAQEKANDAYEKGIRQYVARTEPVGFDRNFNAVYCFLHDPDVLYVEEKKPPNNTVTFHTSSNIAIPYEMQFPRSSWHVIESTSLCDKFASSLDIRGKREFDLYEVLMGPNGHRNESLYRYLYDDIKVIADSKNKIREKEFLLEKLKVAQIKCDEEKGRRSGRLAGQAEIELFQIQGEIEELENQMERYIARNKSVQHTVLDYKEVTGFNALVQFESSTDTRRATREKKGQASTTATVSKLPILNCSKLYPTGNIDGTGLVGMLVSSLLDLEERCNALAQWDRTDVTRANWMNKLENAVSMWHSICADMFESSITEPSSRNNTTYGSLDSPMDSSSRSELKRSSVDQESGVSSTKRPRKTDSPSTLSMVSSVAGVPTVSSILTALKQPLLDLEERVADITNVALATKDADLADDNMSSTDEGEDNLNMERMELDWKRLINKLRSVPARHNTKIHKLLVDAITAARKAHLQQVVAELRNALLLYRPKAPHESKMAAIKVLLLHGDYDATGDNEDDEQDEVNDIEDGENVDNNDDPAIEDAITSVLSAEAAILRSSLGGSDDARREDWVGMVKAVRTMSRLASLTTAFIHDAMEKIVKVEAERDELVSALQIWSRAEERQLKQRDAVSSKAKSSAPREITRPSEVWANVRYTDEICMAKTDEYPWWPAKICDAKDPDVATSLKQVKRSLVAFVGEMGSLRVVKTSCIKPFTGKVFENMDDYSKDIRAQLDDCMAMARRIQRGLASMKKN